MAFAANLQFPNHSGWLLAPVLGPPITIIARDSGCPGTRNSDSCLNSQLTYAALVLDGVFQVSSAIVIIKAITDGPKQLVPDTGPRAQFVPYVQRGAGGVVMVGSF